MATSVSVVTVVLGLLLAGCAGGSEILDDTPPGKDGAPPSASPETVPPSSVVARSLDALSMNDCTGLSATAYQPNARPLPLPSGWTSNQEVNGYYLLVWKCERISFSNYERPTTIAMESFSAFSEPDSCTEGREGAAHSFLSNLWADDPEIVESFRKVGMPAQSATFNWQGTESLFSMQIASESGVIADLRYLEHGELGASGPYNERRFWSNGTGLGYIDLEQAAVWDSFGPVTGTMSDATTWSPIGPALPYAATGVIHHGTSLTGKMQFFGDTKCGQ